jgi:hypothetical protein
MSKLKFFLFPAILIGLGLLGGCSFFESSSAGFFGTPEKATVIMSKAQIRSSYSVVATDLLEVKRGEKLDILEETDYANEHWFRVRGQDSDNTEGWIEARNVITQKVLERSQALANEDKSIPAQGTAQLKSPSNLRLAPDLNAENIMFKLENGATFEVISWKLVPKIRDASDVDDAPKSGEKPDKPKTAREIKKEEEEHDSIDERYDIWYKVRFDPSVSPAPAGWLFGRQVQLQVPADIVHYQIGEKKFVTWSRLDDTDPTVTTSANKNKDVAAKESKAGSWVICAHSNKAKSEDGNEPDFDGIIVIGYDKYDQQHYAVYRSGEIWGKLPLRVEGVGDNKTFTLTMKNANGELAPVQFTVFKDSAGHLKVNAPPEVPKWEKGK